MKVKIDKYTICITREVLSVLELYKQTNNQNEAGGIILGFVFEDGEVVISEVSQPNKFDKASRFGFVRDKKMAQQIVDRAFVESGGKLIYLGEWHTHPETIPKPSRTDKRMIKNQYKKNIINENFLILLIQGIESLYIAVYNGNQLIEI